MLDSVKDLDARARASRPPEERPRVEPPFLTVDPDSMPDFYPPIRVGQTRSDAEGNVWILPSTSNLSTKEAPGLVYDVVNRKGAIVERVRLPTGRTLAGFGPNGAVYLIFLGRAADGQRPRIEKGRIAR